MGIDEKLMRIQTQIKAPKNLYNSFGKYHYRNAESICEAVKPFLANENCTLTICDEPVFIEGRFYIKATVVLTDCESKEFATSVAYARESDSKTGMDLAQVTGATSSYARKYALNGMFLLDDTKDADSDEYKTEADAKASKDKKPQGKKTDKPSMKETPEEAKKNDEMRESVDTALVPTQDGKVSQEQWNKFNAELERTGLAESVILGAVSVSKREEITEAKMLTILKKFSKTPSKA